MLGLPEFRTNILRQTQVNTNAMKEKKPRRREKRVKKARRHFEPNRERKVADLAQQPTKQSAS